MNVVPKYLGQATYTSEGIKGLRAEGGSARMDAARKAINSAGGELESFYFAFGDNDVYFVVDMPDNESMAAVCLSVAASGAVRTKTVVLLTPSEVDQATEKHVDYRPPSGETVM